MTRFGMHTSRLHTPSLPGYLMGAVSGLRTALGASVAPTCSSARPSLHKYFLTSYHPNSSMSVDVATGVAV